jgi:hypothetical protein
MVYRSLVAFLMVGSARAFSMQGSARLATPLRAPMGLLTMAEDEVAAGPLAGDIWTSSPSVKVQGNTLKTWDIGEESTQRVQLSLRSVGRPIDANVELWHTPSYIPTKFRIYTEDGESRPVDAIIETPKHPKTVAVFNTGSMEFPFDAAVANTGLGRAYDSLQDVPGKLVQGGQITSYVFPGNVESVQVLLKTNERNMKALIELTQGPNQVKQFIEVYASVGYKNPFFCVIQTPGANNAIRIINQNTVEFPFDAWVLPYETGPSGADEVVLGGMGSSL